MVQNSFNMPVEEIITVNNKVRIGLWKIIESNDKLKDLILLNPLEEEKFKRLLTENRRKQWLAYRALLSKMLRKEQLNIEYDHCGKPFLADHSHHISVSHAAEYAAAICSPEYLVGIDVEKISKRIEKIRDRFMNKQELKNLKEGYELSKLYLYWCAKEALYKLYGKRNLDFRQQITCQDFEPQKKGRFSGTLSLCGKQYQFTFYYRIIENYTLVYVFDEKKTNFVT